MNTGKVKRVGVKKLYPITLPKKSTRITTEAYINLMAALPVEESALLNFLIKESNSYNTFKYSTKLLHKYSAYIKATNRAYAPDNPIKTNIHFTRGVFIKLIERGSIFKCEREYLINYGLTYSQQYYIAVQSWVRDYIDILNSPPLSLHERIDLMNERILKRIRK